MPRIAYLVSSAREIDLLDSGGHPTGYWAEQALTSYDRFMTLGADVVVMTPDGGAPVIEPCSLEPHFHHPAEDRGYYASVCRTFHRHPDRIRVTLHHSADLELVAARRIARRLVVAGRSAEEAHELVGRAAKIAWQRDRKLVDVMLAEGLDGGLTEASLRQAVEELAVVSAAVAEDRRARLEELDGFRSPVALAGLTDAELGELDALFVPGGHGAMVDLPESPAVARLLSVLHRKGAPVATLGHGAALLLAAPDRLDGQWLFEGFRLTCPTNEEEDQSAFGGLPWYLANALQNAGAVLDDAPYPWASHVVVDRNLITGQNAYSTEAVLGAFGKALGPA
ncbi:DJ-1/PfpI family protein [Lentzea sp. NPDC058436]|uniref:DJ-1/PfpI family protein n=1 Tax=Lentzea sp. NPDC058436 TaxID=3346499 RepID=UPI00365AFA4C